MSALTDRLAARQEQSATEPTARAVWLARVAEWNRSDAEYAAEHTLRGLRDFETFAFNGNTK